MTNSKNYYRCKLLNAIENYKHFDEWEYWQNMIHICMNLNSMLVIIPHFKFYEIYGKITLEHGNYVYMSEPELIKILNDIMENDLAHYDIPYMVRFAKDNLSRMFCSIIKMDLIDRTDELVDVLNI